jgi:hypothetical protein
MLISKEEHNNILLTLTHLLERSVTTSICSSSPSIGTFTASSSDMITSLFVYLFVNEVGIDKMVYPNSPVKMSVKIEMRRD